MAASTRSVKRSIIAKLEQAGTATPKEIAEALGDDWRQPPNDVRLRKMLGRMVNRRLLENPSRGLYRLSPDYRWRGIDSRASTERYIKAFLKERGGVAKTAEIHAAVGGREPGDVRRTYEHQRVTLALKESPQFRQDFGRGYWNLSADHLERLPLLGRWASYRIQRRWEIEGPKSGGATWQEDREDLFSAVGGAFADARGDLSIETVATHPDIAAALVEIGHRSPGARAQALGGLRADIAASGVSDPYDLTVAEIERKAREMPLHLYALFEAGSVDAHLAAPVELYTACATLFGVCPARLSRGEVVKLGG